jgi:predicted nucleic acid-binding protein
MRILVDTSVWIDHFHSAEPHLAELLARDDVGRHPVVVEELALGVIPRRAYTLGLLANLSGLPVLSHPELLTLVDAHRLWGRGLGSADAHLLGSVLLAGAARLWTRDPLLHAAAVELGVAHPR